MKTIYNVIEKIALWCLHLLFRIIRKKPSEDADKKFMEFVKFGLVGVSNTVVSYCLYAVTILIIGYAVADKSSWLVRIDYIIANVISFLLSVLWSFYWNNKYVFVLEEGEKRNLGKALLKTYMSYAFTGLILNNILGYLWIDVLGINKMIAPIITLIVSVPINFILNKMWAFKKDR